MVEACDEILVLEDGQPFVEKQLKGYLGIGIKVKGRLDGTLSQDGELNPDSVARAVGKENKAEFLSHIHISPDSSNDQTIPTVHHTMGILPAIPE